MKWFSTKYPGVVYRESVSRPQVKRRADRSFVIRYRRNGKLVNETIGWESQGATLDEAAKFRGQIIQNIRHGQGFQSIKEKREQEEIRRDEEALKKEHVKRKNTPFDVLACKYLEWAKNNKKTWWVDDGAYRKHLKKELGHIPVKDISVITLERIKQNLKKKGLSERSVQCYLNVVKHMFNRGIGWGLYEGKNPVTETSKIDKKFLKISDNRRLRFLSHEDAKILLNELRERSPQLHDISILSLHVGLRAGEIFNLTWQDIDVVHEIITIRNPKNGETRQAYMTPQLKEMFRDRKPDKARNTDLIFKDRKG